MLNKSKKRKASDECSEKITPRKKPCTELHNKFRLQENFYKKLLQMMYKIDVSIFCLVKKYSYQEKCRNKLTLSINNKEIDRFSDIVIHYNKKSTYVCVEYLIQNYTNQNINYNNLFGNQSNIFSINKQFNSYAKFMFTKNITTKNPKRLIVLTNVGLELNEELELKQQNSERFYAFKFVNVDPEKQSLLKNFLSLNGIENDKYNFFSFSLDENNKSELLKRLEYSKTIQKIIKTEGVPEDYLEAIKEAFFNRLIFITKQPSREKLNLDIRNSIITSNQNYSESEEKMLQHSALSKDNPIICNFRLLMSLANNMFVDKMISAIELTNYERLTVIKTFHKENVSFIINFDCNVTCKDLLSFRKENCDYSLSELFYFFIEEFKKNPNIKYFIIFINSDLDFALNTFKNDKSFNWNPYNLYNIDITNKRYGLLKNWYCIDKQKLHKFSKDKYAILSNLIKYSPMEEEKEKDHPENIQNMKELFLRKIIIASSQDRKLLYNFPSVINKISTPYDYNMLREVILRWFEFHQPNPITERLMRILLDDMQNNRSSNNNLVCQDISTEITFANGLFPTDKRSSIHYDKFLKFITIGEGRKYIADFKNEELKLSSISCMIQLSRSKACEALKKVHDLWFYDDGSLKIYLKVLKKYGMQLSDLSGIVNGSYFMAADVFKELYDLLFTESGEKNKYLLFLEKEQIKLSSISCALFGCGTRAKKAFEDFMALLFDKMGNKTKYLQYLETHQLNLKQVTNILSGAGSKTAIIFQNLFELWFDERGNITNYLKNLFNEKFKFSNLSSILSRSGINAVSAFKTMYYVFFDEEGNLTRRYKLLKNTGISMKCSAHVLTRSKLNASEAFKNFYLIWFDPEGNKTKYFKALEKEGDQVFKICTMLRGSFSKSSKAFKELYDLWYDDEGCKKQCLKYLEENNICMNTVLQIFDCAGDNSAHAFTALMSLWFDENGNKTHFLKNLESNGIDLLSIASVLKYTRSFAAENFANFYDLLFDKNGEETYYMKILKKNIIGFPTFSHFIEGTRNIGKVLKNLIDLWFDEEGNLSRYLTSFENEGAEIALVLDIFSYAKVIGVEQSFKNFYYIWFDKKGEKTEKLKVLERNKVSLIMLCRMLQMTKRRPSQYFYSLYDYWFDDQGKETHYLEDLKEIGIELDTICRLLEGSKTMIVKNFINFYKIFFNEDREKTEFLKILQREDIDLKKMFCILLGSGSFKTCNFMDLYNYWVDNLREKNKYTKARIKVLETNGININQIFKKENFVVL